MNYSFSSVFMAFLTSNILLIVVSLLLCSQKIMVNAGYKLIALLLGFIFVRFLFPFELPFTANLYLPAFLSGIVQIIIYPFCFFNGHEISCWTFLEIIWLIGFIVNIIRNYKSNLQTKLMISYGEDLTLTEPYASTLSQVCLDQKTKNVFQIKRISGINSPMLYGISSPCILLPKGMTLSKNDLYYSFYHEVAHHYHHDLILKIFVNILFLFYWWNPAVLSLRNKYELIVEMRIDNDIISLGPEAKLEYLKCLCYIQEYNLEQQSVSEQPSAPILGAHGYDVTKRFDMILADKGPKRHSVNILITAIVLCIFLLSYVFIIEAYTLPDTTDDPMMFPASSNSYIIDNSNGTYSLYIDDMYFDTMDSLDYFLQDIPVYTREKGELK